MAEITRVPLQPLSRGSLIMLFAGIVIGLLLAAAFAWATAPKGVDVEEVRAGTGENPKPDDVVFISGPPFSQFLLGPTARLLFPKSALVLDSVHNLMQD